MFASSTFMLVLVIGFTGAVYHNQFAVHVPKGMETADKLAKQHGFKNLGQIGTLDNYFLFEENRNRLRKRSAEPSRLHQVMLANEPDVDWFEQQKEIRRVKRDGDVLDRFKRENDIDLDHLSQDRLAKRPLWDNIFREEETGDLIEKEHVKRQMDEQSGSSVESSDSSSGSSDPASESSTPVKRQNSRVISSSFSPVNSFSSGSDPMFGSQWHLNKGARGGFDMNVQPAWNKGYTGKGVVVTILDDGIQTNHPDLRDNYDPLASTDINGNDNDPMPQDNGDNKHGTRCAGEVAAQAFNGFCGVGIAYNASIGGVRMLDGVVNDAVEARALSLNPDHIDIYSASWGPEDDGRTVDGPGPLAKRAFLNGVVRGRGGKGSIFVWASGNGGRHLDNCNCDGYTNSIFTLSISSATQGGYRPWYLEECSSTLATTYSSGTPGRDGSISTVDQDAQLRPDHLCTDAHTGTSASAPIAAGVAALALEANPSLTWRDMQYLVVMSSRPQPLQDESGWTTNGAGRQFSHKFGYGMMDASRMVDLARGWKSLPQQHICQTVIMVPNVPIPDSVGIPAITSTTVDGCSGTINSVRYLEHVQCKISLRYYPRGNLMVALTSPSGTRSILLFPRPRDNLATTFDSWPFLSIHFWGENPSGTWKLEVMNMGSENPTRSGQGILRKWQLIFYGTDENPVRVPRNIDSDTSVRNGRDFFPFSAPSFSFPNIFSQFKRFKRDSEEENEDVQVTLMDVAL